MFVRQVVHHATYDRHPFVSSRKITYSLHHEKVGDGFQFCAQAGIHPFVRNDECSVLSVSQELWETIVRVGVRIDSIVCLSASVRSIRLVPILPMNRMSGLPLC